MGREEGLSSSIVYSIVEDNLGFLWFGTPDGLNKFDGHNFTVYKSNLNDPAAIPNSSAGNLFIDDEGSLWIGTWGGGLVLMDLQSETFRSYIKNSDNKNSISDNRVQSLFQDRNGIYWFGTYQGGLNSYDGEREIFTSYQNRKDDSSSLSHNRVWSITEDDKGILWVGTGQGLNRMNSSDQSFETIEGTEDLRIRTIKITDKGQFYFGTDNGLFLYDLHNKQVSATSFSDKIYAIFEDSKNILWIGTDEGLIRYDPLNNKSVRYKHVPEDPFSLIENSVRVIFEDLSGVLWIGTDGGGLCRFNMNQHNISHFYSDNSEENHLIDNDVFAFNYEDESHIWIGTGEGLQLWNIEENKFFTYWEDEVRAFERDSSGYLWIGCRSGLYGYNLNEDKLEKYHYPIKEIRTIMSGSDGKLWIGTYKNGVYVLDRKTDQLKNIIPESKKSGSLNHSEIWDIFEDSSGSIWIATGEGLNRKEKNSEFFYSYKIDRNDPESLLGIRIYSIFEDKTGRIWIGTDEGLNLWNRQSDNFTRFTTADGLADKSVKSIVEDGEGILWLGSNNGLSRYNPQKNETVIYGMEDNLQGREFNVGSVLALDSGFILFGGIGGFNLFNPEFVGDRNYNYPVVLTGFSVKGVNRTFEHSISYVQNINLTYKENFFTFKFKVLDFGSDDKVTYAYKLNGVDENWVNINDRNHVSYTNIKGGKYSFYVKAANRDHIWSDNELLINLSVSSPPWTRWWAYLSYISLFLILITLVLSWRMRQHKNEITRHKLFVEKLEESVLERTVELKLVNNKLERLSSMDDLTSLYNRRYFNNKYTLEWNRLQRMNLPLSVLMCDIDHFKSFNDFHGHQAGDSCIKMVARIITDFCVRPTDLAVRYGGEVFLIVLPQADSDGASNIASSIREAIEKEAMFHGSSPVSPVVTISIGTATIFPSNEISPMLLVEKADRALYESKDNGRNRITVYRE